MKLVPVQSSAIKAIGYDAGSRELHIQFPSGHVHIYAGVSPESHTKLIGAKSIGKHWNRHIRPFHKSRIAR